MFLFILDNRIGRIKNIAELKELESWAPTALALHGKVEVEVGCDCGDTKRPENRFCVCWIVQVRVLHKLYPTTFNQPAYTPLPAGNGRPLYFVP